MRFQLTSLIRLSVLLGFISLIFACTSSSDEGKSSKSGDPLFTLLSTDSTNLYFSNNITEGLNTNILMYEYFYNGGGVAVGDVNNDGLQDIYFTANMADNKLYLNKGNMQFADITAQSAAAGRPGPWKTGVTMADVNGDGRTDIYVCYSGKVPGFKRVNQLFINQGNNANGIPSFTDQAAAFGLADSSYSTQGSFFDFDKDGDLDMLLLNHNPHSAPVLDENTTTEILRKEDPLIGVRMYRNDNNKFKDITRQSGISSSALTYGLGAGIADINGDGWTDVYICNDYTVPDYLYINNKQGGFVNRLSSTLDYTSHFSMGNDIADINNDGLTDIYTLDMLPEDNRRQKLLLAPDNYEKFDLNLRSGFYYQYMRNMLHLNNGNGTFSEIGQLSGVSNTDWSWAALLADYDNDGWKDIFISNGFQRDYTNMDFLKYMNDYLQNNNGQIRRQNVLDLVQKMPSSNMKNYIFRNNHDLTFSNTQLEWGFDSISNSNGAAYADFDNDGDLDLVTNNINQPAFLYRNEANRKMKHHYLQVKLVGERQNTDGIGAKVTMYRNGNLQCIEQMPARGYQSAVSPILHFGLGEDAKVDSLVVHWPAGKKLVLTHVSGDRLITAEEKNATLSKPVQQQVMPIFSETTSPIAYINQRNNINDFKTQPLLVNPLSFSGPCLVQGDVNDDGLADIFAGGGSGQPASLFIAQSNGNYLLKPQPAFNNDKQSEDADAVIFDANADGFADLYVASGGFHNYAPGDSALNDRLYLGDGKGSFTKSEGLLPDMRVSKSCVKKIDVNADGHTDLFIGGRVIPGRYPEIPESYLLINDGKGHFTNNVSALAPSLAKAGMVTDAAVTDLNGDKREDLIVVGEWMPITVYINSNGKLTDQTDAYFDKRYTGWYNTLLTADFNKDGKTDIVAGNMGLNTQCKASDKEPAEMYFKDFDDNGAIDPVLCFYIQGKSYPYVTRDELLDQLSIMRTRFHDYNSYADATMTDIFTEEELEGAGHLKANHLKTSYFESGADGKFHEKPLPLQAQFSPVFTITPLDYNNDGNEDLLLCGNITRARLRFGNYNANQGVLLRGDGKGNFSYVTQKESGFKLKGDVRSVVELGDKLIFGVNQHRVVAYKLTKK